MEIFKEINLINDYKKLVYLNLLYTFFQCTIVIKSHYLDTLLIGFLFDLLFTYVLFKSKYYFFIFNYKLICIMIGKLLYCDWKVKNNNEEYFILEIYILLHQYLILILQFILFYIYNTQLQLIVNINNKEKCSICLDEIKNDGCKLKTCGCNYYYHPKCISKWFQYNTNCPICKI
jgi:hypothetical protein